MAEIPRGPEEIQALLSTLTEELLATIRSWDAVAFIGIRTGGDLIAKSLVRILEERTGKQIPMGVLDITLYRDDITRRKAYPEVKSTDIPFAVDDKDIILVDDVLYTGRSIRAAIDHIVDLGRPGRIYLLVMFDRGGRELPIQADFTGMKISLPDEQVIKLEPSADKDSIAGVIISEVKR
ncbi:MAG TPA: bifunctional pyr operon transcriptional regulator/uracil phosphoribosyltransferase PyrR [Deltaproteobacteria bacterium]|nr:bifunctional pyr operon transcriptional regulator/uracil phosphoribosyltransferase PyrR [Deltaproteobacteria bacterium]HPR53967.1 bifunctional pyr operon transcriptional regulator/uracil phosphoribosyltransferase PyrR [Deltaproteobacteria bacterium]HXK46410.1 bifunctional pyr operon transcriptional regulator/uracil phosphoribosyltransferase PyrR [Deltaproteobacteria bacterium]